MSGNPRSRKGNTLSLKEAQPCPEDIMIFDTTLRDGEQSPGCSMTLSEKLEVAARLEALGVDVIEAGFAVASRGDFEAVKAVSGTSRTASSPRWPGPCRRTSTSPGKP